MILDTGQQHLAVLALLEFGAELLHREGLHYYEAGGDVIGRLFRGNNVDNEPYPERRCSADCDIRYLG